MATPEELPGADAAPTPAQPADVAPATAAKGAGAGRQLAPEVAGALRTYVYLLVDPRTGRPFLVGRGRNNRCFRHLEAARSGTESTAKFPGLERIRQAEAGGRRVRIDILRHGLTATQAKCVEAVAADALGLARPPAGSPPRGDAGGDSPTGGRRIPADALDSALARPAKFKRAHQVVLLRVPPDRVADVRDGTDGVDPESVRHGWRIGRSWTDPTASHAPRWAVVVSDDLVRAVFRITGWEPSPPSTGPGRPVSDGRVPTSPRFSFAGNRDAGLEERYLGRSVAAYMGPGVQNPVTYVWCGPHWVNRPR